MPRGGAREGVGGPQPGAGRPRKVEKFARPIAAAERLIASRLVTNKDGLPGIVDRMLELADGVTVQEPGPDGEQRIYTRPPDREAAKYLIDRILGKPTERIKHELERLSDDELIATAAALLAAVGPTAGRDGTTGTDATGE